MIHVKPWAGSHQGLLGGPWTKLQNQQSMSRRLLLPKVPLLTRDIMLRSCQRLIVYTWKNVLRLHPVINTVISIHFLIDMCTEGKSHYNIMTPHCAGKPLCTSLWQQLIYRMVKALGTLLGKWLMGDVRVYSLCILLPWEMSGFIPFVFCSQWDEPMGVRRLRPAGPPTGPDWTPGRSGGKVAGELGSGVLGWVWKL